MEEIARGGMGVVYRARQLSLNRVVAVKMVLFGQFAGKHAYERFRAEAETIARLQHPNIVAIHEIGETDGQPYFSMDYVAGRSLAERVGDRPMPARQAAEYVRKIARAVHYAHTQGVLHRDLKPANVLVDEADEPRITDFGLARRLAGDSELTLTGQVVGSPNFMPPEQGLGNKVKLGPASDVYGLGALLYYLVTARAPFVADTFESTLSQVLNNEPAAPRQLNPALPVDLETICLKCLEKDPARRYASAQELADELDRFLQGEPVQARPLGSVGKLWRWCRRKPMVAVMSGALVVALVTGIAGVIWQWRRAEVTAVRERELAQTRLWERYSADMAIVQSRIQQGSLFLARDLLRGYLPLPAQQDLRGFEWYLYDRMCLGDQVRSVIGNAHNRGMVASRDGRLLAFGGSLPGVCLMDPTTNGFDRRLPTWGQTVTSLALSPDERLLGVGSDLEFDTDGSFPGMVELWDLPAQKIVATFKASTPRVAFSPVDPVLAVGSGGDFFGAYSGEVLLWNYGETNTPPEVLHRSGGRAAFSADGRFLVTGPRDMELVIWDYATRRELGHLPLSAPLYVLKFAPRGYLLATGHRYGEIHLWDIENQRHLGPLRGHSVSVAGLEFIDGGKRLVSAGTEQTVRWWDVQKQELVSVQQGITHFGALTVLAPDQTVVTGASIASGRMDFWRLAPAGEARSLREVTSLRFSPGDGSILAQFQDGSLRHLASDFFKVLSVISNPISPATIQADPGRQCASRLLGYVKNGIAFATLDHSPKESQLLRLQIRNSQTSIVERETGLEPLHGFVRAPAVSPDGRLLAAANLAGQSAVWDVESGRLLRTFKDHKRAIMALAFSPDSHLLVSNGADGVVVLRETHGWRRRGSFFGYSILQAGAFSPDGALYAAADYQVYLWNVRSGQLAGTLSGHSTSIQCMAFSPDGRTLATGADDCTVRFWNVKTGREMGALPQGAPVLDIRFSPKGDVLLARPAGTNNYRVIETSLSGQRPPEMALEDHSGTMIPAWRLAGPYVREGSEIEELLEWLFPPEIPKARVDWKSTTNFNGLVTLSGRLLPEGERQVTYLRTVIVSSTDQSVLLFPASDGLLKVTFNGSAIHSNAIPYGNHWEHRTPVRLRSGTNDLLMKIVHRLPFIKAGARLMTIHGQPVLNIRVEP